MSSWGRLSSEHHQTLFPTSRFSLETLIDDASTPSLAFGMGRSYGDVCLNPGGKLILTRQLDRYISFDPDNGILRCESGMLLKDIQHFAVPRGWMLPVTPGTQFVTVGGAIANDVHGKNHHFFGTFGDHVISMKLVRSTGETLESGPTQASDWFSATLGGMGLTGIITEASIQLRPIKGPMLDTETFAFNKINDFFKLSFESERTWEYTIAWIDCLAKEPRGIFMRANHTEGLELTMPPQKARTIPVAPPFSLINSLTLRPFNQAYFHLKKWNDRPAKIHYEPFFYPLDNIYHWNRMYGIKGFYQYQCVVPEANAAEVITAMLDRIANSGEGSFLAVLKKFGNRASSGMLSFPMPGTTLALDFPNNGEMTHKLFRQLDDLLRESGGRIYCAKDARMPRALFEQGYPRIPEFLRYRDPNISSQMSRRLFGF